MKQIKPNHRKSFPERLIFFDSESFESARDKSGYAQHCFRLGAAIFVELDKDKNVIKREIIKFKNPEDFWEWAIAKARKKGVLYFFAHNMKYDLINLDFMNHLKKRGYEMPYPVLSGKFIASAYRTLDNRKIYMLRFVDTFNYLKYSLKDIGKQFGLDKGSVNFEKDDDKTLMEYCLRDVEILERFILSFIKFLNDNDLGSLKETLASTSFSIYRHKFLKEIWYHEDKELLIFERQAYYGGRTECFYLGALPYSNYYIYDVKSMYPYVMKNKELPFQFERKYDNPSLEFIQSLIPEKYIIADCTIKSYRNINPYPKKYDGKLIFPRGIFRTMLHHAELEHAFKKNDVLEIHQAFIYKKAHLFDNFVDFFYSMKESAQSKSERQLAKIIMNSLYGYFAKRYYHTEVICDDELDIEDFFFVRTRYDGFGYAMKKERKTYHVWNKKLYCCTADELVPVRNGNVALAGAVTAYSRMHLYYLLQKATYKHVYYCDTDSLVVDSVGKCNIEAYGGKALGDLELQFEFHHGTIHTLKDYEFYQNLFPLHYLWLLPKTTAISLFAAPALKKIRHKGVPRVSREIEHNVFEVLSFTSLVDYIKTGRHGTVILEKELKRNYDKGIKQKDGFVLPLKIVEK